MYLLLVIAATFLSSSGNLFATNAFQLKTHSTVTKHRFIDSLNHDLEQKRQKNGNFIKNNWMQSSFSINRIQNQEVSMKQNLHAFASTSSRIVTAPAITLGRTTATLSRATGSRFGIIYLIALTSSAVFIPILRIRRLYCANNVGYGLIMPTMHAANLLTTSAILFGLRAIYLSMRDATSDESWNYVQKVIVTAPLLGIFTTWRDTVLEVVENIQTLLLNVIYGKQNTDTQSSFGGPSSFVCKMTRCPVHAGEMFFWIGMFLVANHYRKNNASPSTSSVNSVH
jgi:hypothetical protein